MHKQIVQIEAKLEWRATIGPSGAWVGVCEPLHLVVQADSWSELIAAGATTVQALFRDLLEDNELDGFLRAHGWRAADPLPARDGDVEFGYDLDFQRVSASDLALGPS